MMRSGGAGLRAVGSVGVVTCALLGMTPAAVRAENFMTAAEVRPILEVTQDSWVAVREYDGNDLLYFTHLVAWRCGLEQVRYAINGGELQLFELEPCYPDEATPNAIKAADILPFITLNLNEVDRVTVELTYDDGKVSMVDYERGKILTN